MQDWSKRIESKLDSIVEDISSLKVTAAEHHAVLKEHIRRTEILEAEMKPVRQHVYMVNGGVKLVALIGVILAIAQAVHVLFK